MKIPLNLKLESVNLFFVQFKVSNEGEEEEGRKVLVLGRGVKLKGVLI